MTQTTADRTPRAVTPEVQQGLDQSARIQCAIAFNLTMAEVEAMPVDHCEAAPAPAEEGDQ